MLHMRLARLDTLLEAHAGDLAGDFQAYRNHAYRIANFCAALSADGPDRLEKIGIAAALHDMGIWTEGTFDYLPPSIELARVYLAGSGRAEWIPEITTMILEHHKLSSYRGDRDGLVEAFRRADLIDVSRGLFRFGLSPLLLDEIFATWPSAGFRKRLGQLSLARLRSHPWSPLPMVRL